MSPVQRSDAIRRRQRPAILQTRVSIACDAGDAPDTAADDRSSVTECCDSDSAGDRAVMSDLPGPAGEHAEPAAGPSRRDETASLTAGAGLGRDEPDR